MQEIKVCNLGFQGLKPKKKENVSAYKKFLQDFKADCLIFEETPTIDETALLINHITL